MRVWVAQSLHCQGVFLVAGWQDVPDDQWETVRNGNRAANLRMHGLLKEDPGPTAEAPAPKASVELPSKAADVVKLIKAAATPEELGDLGVQDDDRGSVQKAYAKRLAELGGD